MKAAVHIDPGLLTMARGSSIFLLQYFSDFHHEGCPWSTVDLGLQSGSATMSAFQMAAGVKKEGLWGPFCSVDSV